MNHRYPSVVLGVVLALATGSDALAKTLYVETWGATNGICSKSAPCKDLDDVIANVAGDRDRVIVGTGTFNIIGLDITQTGLKLISAAGARGTTLVAGGGDYMVDISAPKVTIGQRGKGFTFAGVHNNYSVILVSSADKTRIEGNVFVDDGGGDRAIESDSIGDTVRGNEIYGFSDAIYLDAGLDGTKYQVRDNRVHDAGNICIAVNSGQKSRNRISGNVVRNCDYAGFEIYSDTDSGDRIENNVVEQPEDSAYESYGIYVYDGTPQIRRNSVRGLHETGIAVESDGTATIRDNLVSDTGVGLFIGNGAIDATIQDNTIVGSGTSVVFPRSIDSIKKFFRNNLLDYDCPYDLEPANGDLFVFQAEPEIVSDKTFHDQGLIFGNLILNCASDNTAENAVSANFLDISKFSTRANPVKYKGGL